MRQSLVILCLGVPKETWANEKRIALTPAATAMLVKKAIRHAAAQPYNNSYFLVRVFNT
jgi:hypothetical protein